VEIKIIYDWKKDFDSIVYFFPDTHIPNLRIMYEDYDGDTINSKLTKHVMKYIKITLEGIK